MAVVDGVGVRYGFVPVREEIAVALAEVLVARCRAARACHGSSALFAGERPVSGRANSALASAPPTGPLSLGLLHSFLTRRRSAGHGVNLISASLPRRSRGF